MKVLIDTNILISAALSAGGTPFLAYVKAVTHPNRAVVCEQNLDELRRVFNRKFPTKLYAMERFLALALTTIEVVPVPERRWRLSRRYATLPTDPFSARQYSAARMCS